MEIKKTEIPGCYEIMLNSFSDIRGDFTKTFHEGRFKELGLETDWKEEYFSTSKKNVIRGMHFQTPPMDHAKLVTCLSGSVLDVIVDLRKNTPTFKTSASFLLDSSSSKKMIYIPKGCAHGFLGLADESVMFYKVSSVHSSANDQGISWDSIGFDWGEKEFIISERDRKHVALNEYESPF